MELSTEMGTMEEGGGLEEDQELDCGHVKFGKPVFCNSLTKTFQWLLSGLE